NPDGAPTQKRIGFCPNAAHVTWILVRPYVQGSNGHGFSCHAFDDAFIECVLFFFAGKVPMSQKWDLGAVKTNSLCSVDMGESNVAQKADIRINRDPAAVHRFRR